MFFLWGRRNTILKVYTDRNSKCDKCNSPSLNYSVKQNYFHFLWIPVVPNAKYVSTYCPDCKAKNEIHYSKVGAEFEKQTRTPPYMYTMIFLFALLIGYVVFNTMNINKRQESQVNNPMKGDVYQFKFKDDKQQDSYSFIKICDIKNDSILLYQANLYYNQIVVGLSDGYFIKDTIIKSKKDIIKMYNDDIIVRVYRDYDNSSGFNNEDKINGL